MSTIGLILDVRVRDAVPTDIGYVIDSWGRSLRGEYPDARTTDFVRAMRDGIGARLNDGAQLLVAYPADQPDVLVGWLCIARNGTIHFAYTRRAYRRLGVARALLSHLGLALPLHTDSMTNDGRAVRARHPNAIRYLPTI